MAGFKIQCSYFNGQNVSTAVFNILCRLEEKKKNGTLSSHLLIFLYLHIVLL